MLGNPPMLTHWLGALLLAVLGWGAAVMIFNRTYKRLALWV